MAELMRELAAASTTRCVTALLVLDRDGSISFDVDDGVPAILDGVRDESSSKPLHEYVERNRAELEDLARRI